jgi:hypothetical protein
MSGKQPPTFNSKGQPCTIVADCTSGKPALYVVGTKVACIEHKELAFEMARKGTRTPSPVVLPDVGSFEAEIETVEVEEIEVGRFAKLVDD